MRPIKESVSRNFYSKLLLSIVLCTALTLTVSSTVLIVFFNRIVLNQVYQSDLNNLTQTSREVLNMTESAQSLTFQIYRNINVTKLLFYSDPNIYDTIGAMGELSNYLNSMPYIESIYVYNPKSSNVYIASNSGQNGLLTKNELTDKAILSLINNYKQYKPFTPIPRTYKTGDANNAKKSVYTYLCYDAIGAKGSVNSAIIVNISADWINKDIGNRKTNNAGQSFIIDNRGVLLGGEEQELQPGISESILQPVLETDDAGFRIAKVGGVKSFISYTGPDSLEWRYIRVTPYQLITKNVSTILWTTIWIAGGIIVAGLFLSWFLSRKLYVPFGHMANRMNMLESEKRNNLYTIRQQFLRSLVLGTEAINMKSLRSKMAEWGVSIDFQKRYRLILLRIDGFREFSEEKGSDLRVFKYAMMNIGSEIAMQAYSVETVELEGDRVLLIVGESSDVEFDNDGYLNSLLLQIRQAVLEHLKIGISLSYSPVQDQVLQLHTAFKQTNEASDHRFFAGHGAIIRAKDFELVRVENYVFPVDKEKKLVDFMMAGRMEEANAVCRNIMSETSAFPLRVAQSTVSRLTITINSVIHAFLKNRLIESDAGKDLTIPPIEHFETIWELEKLFDKMFDEIHEKLDSKRSMKYEDLIRRINDIIEKNYADPNLSLNGIAGEMDISPSYLGRVYKQVTMHALLDVINRVRIEKSAEMLQSTDKPIAEIADKTGFTNPSYYYRMFKRHFGLTPTDYRKSIGDKK
ncbi:AraC family transcriptional regulator [Cohnella silvisoli]|uniref:Helix-turn-helix domain-containing protein n=1 Tax=Cohnella silvisoli TaxID=2873699 RepID=A0ABV1KNI2_9BACL|nr:helix-turn-helix domain-containing protein [Cohnella silvisoli]MCD9021046.1 helix-turn-helix domain-containing protein [Cohnella silvisoli]